MLAALSVSPALADDSDAWVDVDGDDAAVDVGAGTEESTDGSPARRRGSPSGCTWAAVPAKQLDVVWWENAPELANQVEDPSEYDWYWKSCPVGDGAVSTQLIPVRQDRPSVDPTVLRDAAVNRLELPAPRLTMNPPGDQVVHVQTWLWIDGAIWRTHSKSASAGGVTATVTATPRRVIWDLGNGHTVTCDGPGTPYDPSRSSKEQATDCAYTYRHSSAGRPGDAYRVTATVEWEVGWSALGATGGGPLPALFTSTPVSVRVAELQALNQ